MTNAREFIDQIAAILRAQGRPVEITETEESFGTFVFLSAIAPHWYDRSINLSAAKSNRTNRWRLGDMRVGPSSVSKGFDVKTRSRMKISAEVYA